MKPIRLRFSGLHSYRLPQEIDFTKLCDRGLFGIFGPTGSGKSTVLDALTLALYGKVERASNNTQGIMNHACDSLMVEFMFELRGPQGVRQFRVERSYKRKDEVSVSISHARLSEITAGVTQVLADKDTTVTEEIKELLGLTHEDFTRAVVLPQGKFAQFLSLQGSQRRPMLERIFSLESYGEKLLTLIKSRSDKTRTDLERVKGEQQGLGDCSKEQVTQIKEALTEAIKEVELATKALEKAKETYSQGEKNRLLQNKLTQCEQAIRVLEGKSMEIAHLKEVYEKGLRAEPLRKELQSLSTLEQEVKALRQEYEKADCDLINAQNTADEAETLYKKAQDNKDERIPNLLVERTRMTSLLEDEKQYKQIESKHSEIKKEHERLLSQFNEVKAGLDESIATQKRMEANIARMQSQEKKLQVSSEYRHQMNQLSNILQQLKDNEEDLKQRDEEIKKATEVHMQAFQQLTSTRAWREKDAQALEVEKMRLQQLKTEAPIDEDTLREEMLFIQKAKGVMASFEQFQVDLERERIALEEIKEGLIQKNQTLMELAQTRESLSNSHLSIKEKLNELELSHLAYRLAQELQPDKPCLVCGSLHHPAVNQNLPHLDQGKALEEEFASVTHELEIIKKEEIELKAQVKNEKIAEGEALNRIGNIQVRMDELLAVLPVSWRKLSSLEINQILKEEEESFNAIKEKRETWLVEINKAETMVAELTDKAQKSAEEFNEANNKYVALNERLQNVQKAYHQAEKRVHNAVDQLIKISKGLSVEEIKQRLIDLDNMDRAQERLHRELTEEIKKKDNLDEEIILLSNSLHELDISIVKTAAQLEELIGRADELNKKIQGVTKGEPIEALLQMIADEIDQIQNEYQRTLNNKELAANKVKGLEQHKAATQKALKLVEANYLKQENVVRDGLIKAGFSDAIEAKGGLLDDEVKKRLKQEIDQYETDLAKLQEREKELEEEIGTIRIDESSWERICNEYKKAEQAHNSALSSKGAKERDYQDILSKQTTWNKLEDSRQRLQKEYDLLEQLSKVFKGKRFVEFIAEEYLNSISLDASELLGTLSRQRYALEVDSKGGFVIRDDFNGGVRRPVTSLSGGETFLASLALALALSNQIQLAGTYPLEFFFLDEGFGTLDPGLLDEVITSLERMQLKKVSIGIISHVSELYQRVSTRVMVQPGVYSGEGSTLRIEMG